MLQNIKDALNDEIFLSEIKKQAAAMKLSANLNAKSDYDKMIDIMERKGLDKSYILELPGFIESYECINLILSDNESRLKVFGEYDTVKIHSYIKEFLSLVRPMN